VGGFEFQTDEKQHHHHAEFCKMHDVFAFLTDETQDKRSDDDSAQKITENRTHPQFFGNGNKDHRGSQIDQSVMEKSADHGFPPCVS